MIRSAPWSRQPATAPEADHAGAEHHAGRALPHLGRVHRGSQPGREAAGEQAGGVERRVRVDLGERDLRHHGVLGEGRGAHEVADPLVATREPRGPVGQVPLALLLADRQAEVGSLVAAVDAFAALRREQGHDMVADREVLDALADRLDDPGALVSEDGRRSSRKGRRLRRCRGRCGRRRRRRGAPAPRRAPGRRGHAPGSTSGSPNSSKTAARIFIGSVLRRRGPRSYGPPSPPAGGLPVLLRRLDRDDVVALDVRVARPRRSSFLSAAGHLLQRGPGLAALLLDLDRATHRHAGKVAESVRCALIATGSARSSALASIRSRATPSGSSRVGVWPQPSATR